MLANSCVLATQRGVFETANSWFPRARHQRKCEYVLSEVPCFADVEAFKRKAPWLPSLCWSRDAFVDAALLVSSEEGMFLPLRRFHLALLALTRVSGKEAGERLGEPPRTHVRVRSGPVDWGRRDPIRRIIMSKCLRASCS